MFGRRIAFSVLIALSGLGLLAWPAEAQVSARRCHAGRPLVDVTYRFLNEQDVTSDGRVWALDSGFSSFRLYQTGANTFCAQVNNTGTFTTFAGESPGGTGTVPAGVTGYFGGQGMLHFVGTFAPTLPTRGFVGTFNGNCNQVDCATPTQFGRKYIDVAGPPEPGPFRAAYVSRCGVWVQTSEGEFGDIAC